VQVLAWYWPPVLFVCLIGIGVGLYHHFGEIHGAPCVTCGDYSTPFTLTSFALALLLVFRTNSSYDRRVVLAPHTTGMTPEVTTMHRGW
jgi:predicted membrane chloride channel (bestrophin family)